MGPQYELSLEAFKEFTETSFYYDLSLLKRIHAFLERHCYINYGLFRILPRKTPKTCHKIIVIGAGFAGLMASLQLRFFGFEVILLEGRPRTGGRVMTYQSQDIQGYGDLGGMILKGIVGNPLMTIVQQAPIKLIPLNRNSIIYDNNGKQTLSEQNHHTQQAFHSILDTCTFISKELKINSINNKPLSLGATIDIITHQMELQIQNRRAEYWRSLHSLAEKQRKLLDECFILSNDIKRFQAEIDKAFKSDESYLFKIDINECKNVQELKRLLELRCFQKDLKIAVEKFKSKSAEIDIQRLYYKELLKAEPCEVYFNGSDKKKINFYKAELEAANGCSLDKLALKYWNIEENSVESKFMVIGGFAKITNFLSDALKDVTKKSHFVTNIEVIENGGVKVTGFQEAEKDKQIFEETAAAVVCTIPLGVLKYSNDNPKAKDTVTFSPPLPKWKTEAIERMGFGSLNKAVIFFKEAFWESKNEDIFCRLSETAKSRGETFKFYAVPNEPVLIAIISGEAANIDNGDAAEEQLKIRTMLFLCSTFPECPSVPVKFVLTRWEQDKYTRGCFSYASVDGQDRDRQLLSEPICDSKGFPRIFFGGEHTSLCQPSTIPGAMLSGMREATRVADAFHGTLPIIANENLITKAAIQSMKEVKMGEDEDVKFDDEESDTVSELASDDEPLEDENIDVNQFEKLLA
uniref:SWIRM domain-containing protein n=1 Tax=Panagrolaimus sp. ES5 TaxID=591445 RepID=A0AC34F8L4_9BILA